VHSPQAGASRLPAFAVRWCPFAFCFGNCGESRCFCCKKEVDLDEPAKAEPDEVEVETNVLKIEVDPVVPSEEPPPVAEEPEPPVAEAPPEANEVSDDGSSSFESDVSVGGVE